MSTKNSILGLSDLKKKPLNFMVFLKFKEISCLTVEHGKSFIASGPGKVFTRITKKE